MSINESIKLLKGGILDSNACNEACEKFLSFSDADVANKSL